MYNQIIIMGVIVSMLFTEITGLSAGLVVPGYLALSLHSPLRIIFTLIIAAAATAICRGLANVVILYGRRRFALLMLLTFLLAALLKQTGLVSLDTVGMVIPGLIAREFDRQGFTDTLLALCTVTAIIAAGLLVMGYGSFL